MKFLERSLNCSFYFSFHSLPSSPNDVIDRWDETVLFLELATKKILNLNFYEFKALVDLHHHAKKCSVF